MRLEKFNIWKYKNFNLRVRKFHFPKYQKFFNLRA